MTPQAQSNARNPFVLIDTVLFGTAVSRNRMLVFARDIAVSRSTEKAGLWVEETPPEPPGSAA